MDKDKYKDKVLVTPGDKIGVIEEFTTGPGTYVVDGGVYSQIVGYLRIEMKKRRVEVIPKVKKSIYPKSGDIVVGFIQQTQDKYALVKIRRLNNYELKDSFFTGILHVSLVSKSFVKVIPDAFKVGDVVRAEVIDDENYPFQLTTAKKDLGAIQSYCSKCGSILALHGKNLLCLNCKNIEKRKISILYGKNIV
ncbi:MAG: exosome complex RNA-binding protein Csl4 [Candidatus Bathyarchaeota archaeon]